MNTKKIITSAYLIILAIILNSCGPNSKFNQKYNKPFKHNTPLIKNDIRTITEGRSEIFQNGDLFIEESNYGRSLFFNSDGSLRWTHVNRSNNGNVYRINWSRYLYNNKDIQNAKNFLLSRDKCSN